MKLYESLSNITVPKGSFKVDEWDERIRTSNNEHTTIQERDVSITSFFKCFYCQNHIEWFECKNFMTTLSNIRTK